MILTEGSVFNGFTFVGKRGDRYLFDCPVCPDLVSVAEETLKNGKAGCWRCKTEINLTDPTQPLISGDCRKDDQYGSFRFICYKHPDPQGNVRCRVQCRCGRLTVVHEASLLGGLIPFCRECTKKVKEDNLVEYVSWKNLVKIYGKKGEIEERWLGSFENFLADLGKRPEGKLLNRVDRSKKFGPDNCYWGTTREVRQLSRDDIRPGMVFGNFTVEGLDLRDDRDATYWFCRCECGTVKSFKQWDILNKIPHSCGCMLSQHLSNRSARHQRTHGMSKTRVYKTWCNMISRCYNSKSSHFELYGGRGITVCDRWRNSFEDFYTDIGDPPSPKHSIDRKDNDGNYEPGNCRWATQKEQGRNRGYCRQVVYNGTKMSAIELAEMHTIPYKSFLGFLRKGYNPELSISLARSLKNFPLEVVFVDERGFREYSPGRSENQNKVK